MSSDTSTSTAEQAASAPEAPAAASPITIKVGQLSSRPREIRGTAGMTVSQALAQAGIAVPTTQPRRGGRRGSNAESSGVFIRGREVQANDVLQDHDVVIVSERVRGGSR